MKSTIAPPAISATVRSRAEIENQWDMLCGQEQQSAREFKTRKAMLLIEARATFDSRGDGFVEYVEKRFKTPFSTAFDWMKAAGYKPPKKPGQGAKPNYSETRNKPTNDEQSEPIETEVECDPPPVHAPLVVQKAQPILDMRPMPSESPLADAITTAVKSVVSRASALQGACEDLSNLLRANKATVGGIQFGITRTNALLALSALKESLAIMEGKSNG